MREKDRMEKDVSNNLLLSVNRLMSNGTVLETREQLEQSIFADMYKRAENLVKGIIRDNYNWKRNTKTEFSSSNVISFIGRRGTGKTSAMCSFAEELKDANYEESIRNKLEDQDVNGRVCFHVLDRIDASTLEASEDMFLLILANMFAKLLEREKQKSGMTQGYEDRVLFEKFEGIFENFKALDQNTDHSGYSIFEQLKNMASSQRIREDFKDLVDMYLNEMEEDGKRRDCYLVVLIDDLDMAKQKKEQTAWNWGSYKIMNSIYKYLTVPRVIVLTAYNAENLYSQCVSYYKNQYEEGFARYESLASQFMEKVFPIYTRLYLPSWRKADLDTSEKIRMNLEGFRDDKMHQIQEKQKAHLSIRQFIMVLLSERTGIYFCNLNKETHFLEPDTLRTLFNMVVLLNGLRPYEVGKEESTQKEETFNNLLFNLDVLKKDCLFRFASDQLSDIVSEIITQEDQESVIQSEYEKFHQWQSMPIVLRSKQIFESVGSKIYSLNVLEDEQSSEHVFASSEPYSYAQLVYCIYAMKDKMIKISPQFGDCLLYSYTLYMTELYEKYLHYKRKVGKNEYIHWNRLVNKTELSDENINIVKAKQYYTTLKDIMGNGICANWTQYYYPQLRFYINEKGKGNKYKIGYVENYKSGFSIKLDAANGSDNVQEEFTDTIRAFLFAAMLQTNVMKWNTDNFTSEWIKENECEKLQVSFEFKDDDFDLTMPFFYQFCYAEFLNKMESEIQTCVNNSSPNGEKEQLKGRIKENITKAFDKIWSDYYKWDQKYGNMMLPVYNLDVMYNMMVSLYKECTEEASVEVTLKDCETVILPEYLKMLDRFRNYLNDNNEKFGLDVDEGYVATFVHAPFYQMVTELNEPDMTDGGNSEARKNLKIKIAHYMMKAVEYLVAEENTASAPD